MRVKKAAAVALVLALILSTVLCPTALALPDSNPDDLNPGAETAVADKINEPEKPNEPEEPAEQPEEAEEPAEPEESAELSSLDFDLMTLGAGENAVAAVVPRQPNGTGYKTVVGAALSAQGTPDIYGSLEAALNAAVSGQAVVLLTDYTMTQSATLKYGVFLLLPCGDDLMAYDSTGFNPDGKQINGTTGFGTGSALYRTLTIAQGAKLEVSGEVLVNAVTGRPQAGHFDMDINGGYSKIALEGELLVLADGMVEVCGLVTGTGQVTVNSGGSLYDLFVVRHWRGGTQAYHVALANVYPMNEYDCHNVQTTIHIKYGGMFGGTVKMYASDEYHYTRFPQIDNSNGLIRLTAVDAYAIKTYDSSAKRSTIELYGGADANRSTLKIVGIDMSTGSFLYPVDGDLTFKLYNGTYNLTESFKFLTGTELYVGNGAVLNANKTVVFYDEFNDVYEDSTRYPSRAPAKLMLEAGSKLNIAGTFAGQISSNAASNEVALVTIAADTALNVSTCESNTQAIHLTQGLPVVIPLDFSSLLLNESDFNNHTPSAGMTYLYSDGKWSGGDIAAGTGSGKITGSFTAQGRSNHSGIKVMLRSDTAEYTLYTGANGEYSISGLEQGSYELTASCAGYLSYTKKGIIILAEQTVTVQAKTLSGGDANGDGTVTILDLNILLGNFQRPGNGDVNGDGTVTILDLNILLGNFQKSKTVEQ